MPIKFCLEAYLLGLRFFNEPEISDSGTPAYSPPRRTCAQDFYVLKKSIDLIRIWSREPDSTLVKRSDDDDVYIALPLKYSWQGRIFISKYHLNITFHALMGRFQLELFIFTT